MFYYLITLWLYLIWDMSVSSLAVWILSPWRQDCEHRCTANFADTRTAVLSTCPLPFALLMLPLGKAWPSQLAQCQQQNCLHTYIVCISEWTRSSSHIVHPQTPDYELTFTTLGNSLNKLKLTKKESELLLEKLSSREGIFLHRFSSQEGTQADARN